MSEPQIIQIATLQPLFQRAAELVFELARDAISRDGIFRLALSGGSTPRGLHQRLAAAPDALPWDCVRFFFGDERHVPPDHPDSNYRMALETLFQPLKIASSQVHRMRGEATDLDAAAREYEKALQLEFGERPCFDLVVLGMGVDGHTASLFPQTAALRERSRWVVANDVPAKKTRRLTLTYPVINQARAVLFLVAGPDKASALHAVLEGPPDIEIYPAQGIDPVDGQLIYMIDDAAAVGLSRRSGTRPDEPGEPQSGART